MRWHTTPISLYCRWATAIHGYLGVPGSRMPVQPPDTRTSGSLPRARPRFDKSALRTACEATCEGYITLKARTLTEILKLCWQVGAGVWGEHNYPQFTTAVKRIIILNCMYRAANITQVWFVLAPAVWLWAEGECTTTHTSSRDKSTMTPCLRADIRA